MLELFQELFAELGRPLDAATYERELAGMSDPEIAWAWLGRDHPAAAHVIAERDAPLPGADGRRLDHPAAGARGGAPGRRARAGRDLLGRGPQRDRGDARRRGHRRLDRADRGGRGRCCAASPRPDGYLAAHRLLAPDLPAGDVLVFEDTEVGVLAALGAGLRCVAVLGTMGADRLAAAERVVPELDSAIMRDVLGLIS